MGAGPCPPLFVAVVVLQSDSAAPVAHGPLPDVPVKVVVQEAPVRT